MLNLFPGCVDRSFSDLVSISVLLLDHSPQLWIVSPPMVGESGSSLSKIMSHELHLAGEGAPAQAPTISTFSEYSYAAVRPPSGVILLGDGPIRGIHSSEGLLIRTMEARNWFRTMNPNEAHVYFLPFIILTQTFYTNSKPMRETRPKILHNRLIYFLKNN